MNNTDEKTDVNISDRIVFLGKLSKLYDLSKKGEIETKLQGSHTRACKFWTAMKILSGVKNSIVITHGPSGCAYGVKQAYKLTNCRNSGSLYEPVLSTGMDQTKVVYGGEKELKTALLEVEKKYAPDVIFVATSCAAGIIGDNVDDIIEKMRPKINAEILPIHCEGFAGEYRSGFDLVFRELVRFMDPPASEMKKTLSRSVNIVGSKMGPERTEINTDVKELIRLLTGMGAQINAVIAGDCSLEELKRAPSVAVNCTLCLDIGYAIGMAMLDEFETPLNSTILPYGIAATVKWLEGCSKELELEVECRQLIAREYAAIKDEFQHLRKYLEGKTAIIEGHDAIKSLAIAHMLEMDLGMQVVIYNFHPWSTEARETSIDYLLETGFDPQILITKGTLSFGKYESMLQTEEELLSFIGNLDKNSTVYFGSSLSFPCIPVVDLNAILNRPRFGFRGALKVAKCIKTALEYSFRPRSELMKEIVFPEKGGLGSAQSLTPKLSSEVPDCTMYAKGGKRGRLCCMN